jgi:uncharacterized RDD family membrane protein YckC
MDKKLRPSIFRRFLALIIDFIIIGLLGYLSGLFLEEFYVSLGVYGTLIGTTIVMIYFSLLQSKLGGGQSIGKIIIGTKVTSLNGEYLTLEKSFLRSFILYFPILNAMIFFRGIGLIVFAIIFIMIISTMYLIFVNKSRRTLHDILTDSIVLNKSVSDFEIDSKNDYSRNKLIPIAIISAVIIIGGCYLTLSQNTFGQLISAKSEIEKVDGVLIVNGISFNKSTTTSSSSPAETHSYIALSVKINNKAEASNVDSKYFETFYEIIKDTVPEAADADYVNITLNYGYDIGIASNTVSVMANIKK